MNKSGVCYVFGAVSTAVTGLKTESGDLVIAADGGYDTATKMGFKTDIFVGDCDSLNGLPGDVKRCIKLPVEKDDTDVFFAAKIGIEEGYEQFVFIGCTKGERSDHTFANIQTLTMLAKNGKKCKMVDEEREYYVIANGSVCFDGDRKGLISVFSLTEKSTGCNEIGLKYPLKDAVLSFDFPVGVSNQFCGVPSVVSVCDGVLLLIVQNNTVKE